MDQHSHVAAARVHLAAANGILTAANDPEGLKSAVEALYASATECLEWHLAHYAEHADGDDAKRQQLIRDPLFKPPLTVYVAFRNLRGWYHDRDLLKGSWNEPYVRGYILNDFLRQRVAGGLNVSL